LGQNIVTCGFAGPRMPTPRDTAHGQ